MPIDPILPPGSGNLAPTAPGATAPTGGGNLAPDAPSVIAPGGTGNLSPAAPGATQPTGGANLSPATPADLVPAATILGKLVISGSLSFSGTPVVFPWLYLTEIVTGRPVFLSADGNYGAQWTGSYWRLYHVGGGEWHSVATDAMHPADPELLWQPQVPSSGIPLLIGNLESVDPIL